MKKRNGTPKYTKVSEVIMAAHFNKVIVSNVNNLICKRAVQTCILNYVRKYFKGDKIFFSFKFFARECKKCLLFE